MSTISVVPGSKIALDLLRSLQSAESGPPSLNSEAERALVDPRSALTLSTTAADAILKLVRANKSVHTQVDEQSHTGAALTETSNSQIPSDEEFARSMMDTPPDLAVKMRADGATKWIHDPEFHYSYDELKRRVEDIVINGIFHGISSGIVDQTTPDDTDPRKRAVLNGTAKIIRGNDISELGIRNYRYYSYGPRGSDNSFGQIGGASKSEINLSWFDNFKKDNPKMNVDVFWLRDDMAILIYSKDDHVAHTK